MRLPRPGQISDALRGLRRIRGQGGPTEVRLEKLERPRGWLFPTSAATLEIRTRSGERVKLTPELPVPWPYAWGYRLARQLDVPVAASLEPDDIRLSLPVPDFVRRHLSRNG
jgi:hypothetical protein